MKTHCNPLLKSWNDYMRDAAKFAVLRRECRGFIVGHPSARRIKKKGRR